MSPGSSVTLGEWTRSRVKGAAGISPRVACRRLLCFVRLSSERARHGVHQDCSFGKKQESRSVLLVVVRSERADRRRSRSRSRAGEELANSYASEAPPKRGLRGWSRGVVLAADRLPDGVGACEQCVRVGV